jgi:UDPglucose 6-dehydrogenase
VKVAVYGLSHLGSVTAACLAEAGIDTIGIDEDASVIAALLQGKAPLFEPGLDKLISAGLKAGRLSFSSDLQPASDAPLVWVTFDTPVAEDDSADTEWVKARVERLFPHLAPNAVLLVSSQLPVGSTAALERRFTELTSRTDVVFACSPENLRLGQALQSFNNPPGRVVGTRSTAPDPVIGELFGRLEGKVIWMSHESAEMVKHALNAFLALCVAFTNELGALCDVSGADTAEVESGLRLDPRVGSSAYVRAGAAFAGGTLARDVNYLVRLAEQQQTSISLIPEILTSNERHRLWPLRQLERYLGEISDKTVAILGLSYKPGTSSVRRSASLDLARRLGERGACVRAFDIIASAQEEETGPVQLCNSVPEAISGADAVVAGEIDAADYKLDAAMIKSLMRRPVVIDQNGVFRQLAAEAGVEYFRFGGRK